MLHFYLSAFVCFASSCTLVLKKKKKKNHKQLITLSDFCEPTPAVNQMWNSTAALICHVLHTAPCGVLQTEIEIVTWQQDPLFALRLTHLYTHLFIGLFE